MTVAPKPPVKEGAARGVTEQSGAQKQLTAWQFPVGVNIHVPHDAAILFLEKRKLTFPQKYVH